MSRSIFNKVSSGNYGPVGNWNATVGNIFMAERSIVAGIFNRIAIDVAAVDIAEATVDHNGLLMDFPDDRLNFALRYKPNTNQTPSAFKRDIVMTMCTDGVAAVVRTIDEAWSNTLELQVGVPFEFYPKHVKVRLWNNARQVFQDVVVPKSNAAIIENPLYAVMNENGSAIQRLLRKLGGMDAYTEQASKGKINAFIGIPYELNTDFQRAAAEARIKSIEEQAANSKYGFTIIGANDKVTFPPTPVNLNILEQVKDLENEVYAQLGVPRDVFIGTATEDQRKDYQMKTVSPFVKAITEAMNCTEWVPDPSVKKIISTRNVFEGLTGETFAQMTDVFGRNSVVMPNEVRSQIGYVASDDPIANSLANKNMPIQDQMAIPTQGGTEQ